MSVLIRHFMGDDYGLFKNIAVEANCRCSHTSDRRALPFSRPQDADDWEAECRTRRAVCSTLKVRLWGLVATTPSPHLPPGPLPRFVLLRRLPCDEWSLRDFAELIRNQLTRRDRDSVRLDPPLGLAEMHGMAALLRMLYAGTWVDTLGNATSFQSSAETLP